MKLRIAMLASLLWLMASSASADGISTGQQAPIGTSSFAHTESRAREGDPQAQRQLGVMYRTGRGVEKDVAQALSWTRKAAEQGLAAAQNDLGMLYFDGAGVEKNMAKADEWFQKAAAQGHAHAQYNIGVMYRDGTYRERNPQSAIAWMEKAAQQGHADAQSSLGAMYYTGDGVEADHAKGLAWFQRAAASQHKLAYINLGMVYAHGAYLPKNAVISHALFSLAADTHASIVGNYLAIMKTQMSPQDLSDAEALKQTLKQQPNVVPIIEKYAIERPWMAPHADPKVPNGAKPEAAMAKPRCVNPATGLPMQSHDGRCSGVDINGHAFGLGND